jgi:hypothetical protein
MLGRGIEEAIRIHLREGKSVEGMQYAGNGPSIHDGSRK